MGVSIDAFCLLLHYYIASSKHVRSLCIDIVEYILPAETRNFCDICLFFFGNRKSFFANSHYGAPLFNFAWQPIVLQVN